QTVNISAEDAYTGGVKRAHPDALRTEAYYFVHSLPHLAGRLVGKRDRQDIPGVDPAVLDQMGNAVGQHPCLARSGPCQDQKRSLCAEYRFLLLFIQKFQTVHPDSPSP